ncbi:hypothetical protein SRHO_G00022650 [Serrasalmus rhombeus]
MRRTAVSQEAQTRRVVWSSGKGRVAACSLVYIPPSGSCGAPPIKSKRRRREQKASLLFQRGQRGPRGPRLEVWLCSADRSCKRRVYKGLHGPLGGLLQLTLAQFGAASFNSSC